ncbi:MAG TPA: PAS domain-containing protein [Solirubrobacteraceae bacterium]
MSVSDPSAITGMGLARVVAQMPAAVIVVEAPSGRIVHVNARARDMAERQLGRPVPHELTPDWEIFHPDGRRYAMKEWPLVRSITTGEEVVDEEYFNVLPDGGRMTIRCSSSPIREDEGRIVAGVLVMTDVTEQKRQEERLKYLAGLLDNTEDAIVALDAEWLVTVWNKGAERMYGWTADEVVGRHTLEVAYLDMSDEERAAVRHVVAEHGRWRGEVVARRKDGAAVSVELITVALRGERGETTGFLGLHRDIGERKEAEEALRSAQRHSETILESITDVFVAVDREWRYTYVNARALRRMQERSGRQLTREGVLGQRLWEMFPDAVGSEVYETYQQAMREQRQVEFEAYFAPSGEWIETHVYPSGSGLFIYFRNIDERKQAEEERERRVRQQALVADLGLRALATDDLQELMDEAVALVARTLEVELSGVAEMPADSDDVILRAGVGWREGFVGRRIERDRDSQVGYTLLQREPVIAEDQATDQRFKPSTMTREHGVVSALTVMIESPDEPFGVLEALSTRRRRFSESDISFVQAVANVLAGAVERSRAEKRLAEVKEIERRRIARELHDEALQELTHAVALASRRLRRDSHASDELAAALKRVGEQLRGAIYDLRLGDEQDTPFPELLEALVAVHRAMAVGFEIELEVGDDVPTGRLGATGIEVLRILGEALTNARRHARPERVQVRVWASDVTLRAEVSDDGHGFAPASRSAPADGHGTRGMHERAELLHGRLDISSDPAAGTTVRLEVPLARELGGAVDHVRVLLVEDQTAVREAIASAFTRDAGFDVVGQAASLAEARGMLHDVDVAVLDLGLPDGFGADLIDELREISPRAQALVLSATLDHAAVARAIQRGAAGALDKMAHLDEVVDTVRRLRAGEILLPMDEVVELLRFAGRQEEQERQHREAIARLTPREREVLQALGDGLGSQQIAARLHITIRTQRNHVASILAKLGVHSQLQAVLFALRYGVITLPS